MKRNVLLTPGPVTTTDSVKQALVVPDLCPREDEFADILREVASGVLELAGAGDSFAFVPVVGSGTAAMDATINSVVPPGGRIAVVNNGAYGKRMVDIAASYGISCRELSFDWASKPSIVKIEDALSADPEVNVLAMVHHETTTGLLNPVTEVGAVAARYGCTFVVDAISSFAAVPLDLDAARIDFLLGTGNKGLQGMPGLAFVLARKQALASIVDYPPRSFYLNLVRQQAFFAASGHTEFTPPVQVAFALRQAIEETIAEGLENRRGRYSSNWMELRTGLSELGFDFLLEEEDESRLLITVVEPDDPNWSFDRVHELLLARDFTIYPGKLHDSATFRLATIGAIDTSDITSFLGALREVLEEIGVKLV